MYFQFLIEDASAEILIGHVMGKLQDKYPEKEILFDTKSFTGIGHLRTTGNLMERKGGNLLNNLHIYLRGFIVIYLSGIAIGSDLYSLSIAFSCRTISFRYSCGVLYRGITMLIRGI